MKATASNPRAHLVKAINDWAVTRPRRAGLSRLCAACKSTIAPGQQYRFRGSLHDSSIHETCFDALVKEFPRK